MKNKFYTEEELVFAEKSTNGNFNDLEGLRFKMLMVIGFSGIKNNKRTYWYCKCDCGSIVEVLALSLKNGCTVSCGCFGMIKSVTHGHKRNGASSTYNTWANMLQRCKNTERIDYHRYGGRGIKVCDRWLKFENFLKDMGERPDGLTIERIDNNGNYEPGNCQWSDRKVQANNTRRNHLITFMGESKTLAQWATKYHINWTTLYARIYRYKWDINKALTFKVK